MLMEAEMRRLTLPITLAVVFLLLLAVSPTTAASPQLNIKIVADTVFTDPPMIGTFQASGQAVDAGLVCPAGVIHDLQGKATGAGEQGINFHVTKEFICADGSGSFIIQLEARVDYKGDNGNWVLKGGSGAYADLHGSGSLVGIYYEDGSGIQDIFTGKVH